MLLDSYESSKHYVDVKNFHVRDFPAIRACRRKTPVSGQFDQIAVLVGPEILGAVWQQHHPLRIERLGGTRVVGHQHHRTRIAAQRVEHLFARRRVEVVGGLVE